MAAIDRDAPQLLINPTKWLLGEKWLKLLDASVNLTFGLHSDISADYIRDRILGRGYGM